MDVSVLILPPEDAAFADALFAGETLATASGRASELDAGFDFGAALVGLVSLGAFGAIDTKGQSDMRTDADMAMTARPETLLAKAEQMAGRDPAVAAAACAALCARRAVLQVRHDEMGRLPAAFRRRGVPVHLGVQAAHLRPAISPIRSPTLRPMAPASPRSCCRSCWCLACSRALQRSACWLMTAIIQITVPEGWANFHLPWAAMALTLVVFGGGRISLDALVRR